MKKIFYTWQDVEAAANTIVNDLAADNWRPDYVVGITRGGLALALLLSHKLGVRMETLKVKLRDVADGECCETNCWMAEDAFGYANNYNATTGGWSDPLARKKILVVDDINDSGATFAWIKDDWQNSCMPNNPVWTDEIFGGNVRFAVMTENLSSDFGSVSYYWHEVNKAEDNTWLVYPWEKESWLPNMA